MQKSSILEVRLGSKYTLSIELLLDRFGQLIKFRKKSKKKFRDIQQMTPHRPYDVFSRLSRGRSKNVLGTSRINLTGCHLETSPGRQIGTSPRSQFGTFLASSWNQVHMVFSILVNQAKIISLILLIKKQFIYYFVAMVLSLQPYLGTIIMYHLFFVQKKRE